MRLHAGGFRSCWIIAPTHPGSCERDMTKSASPPKVTSHLIPLAVGTRSGSTPTIASQCFRSQCSNRMIRTVPQPRSAGESDYSRLGSGDLDTFARPSGPWCVCCIRPSVSAHQGRGSGPEAGRIVARHHQQGRDPRRAMCQCRWALGARRSAAWLASSYRCSPWSTCISSPTTCRKLRRSTPGPARK